jgi:hypothetical protein
MCIAGKIVKHLNVTSSLCVLQDPNAPESGEDCFQPLTLSNGEPRYDIQVTDKTLTADLQVKLPDGLTCDRCVLRWHYNAGNANCTRC